MRGVYYNRIDTNKRSVGLIAQEVLEILPEVVDINGSYLGVNYGNIIGVLVEAVKQLNEQNVLLKQSLDELYQRINI